MAIFSPRHCNRSTISSHLYSKQENTCAPAGGSLKHTGMLCLETPEILSIKAFIYGKCWFSAFWSLIKEISYLSLPLCIDNQFYSKEGKMVLEQSHVSKQVIR